MQYCLLAQLMYVLLFRDACEGFRVRCAAHAVPMCYCFTVLLRPRTHT